MLSWFLYVFFLSATNDMVRRDAKRNQLVWISARYEVNNQEIIISGVWAFFE